MRRVIRSRAGRRDQGAHHPRRTGRIRTAIGDLTGRAGRRAIRLIEVQLAAAARGAELSLQMAAGNVETAQARRQMTTIEHDGDESRSRLVAALVQSLATPVDREDLYRLSRSVDDVLDNLRDFVREADLYQPAELQIFVDPLTEVAAGLAELGKAIAAVTTGPREATGYALASRAHAGRVRALYQRGLGDLFSGVLTMETLKVRELLRRLDVVALRMNESADALGDGLLKRHY